MYVGNFTTHFFVLLKRYFLLLLLGAINEAGHTLADAYANNPLLSWIVNPLKEESKQHDIRYALFKAAVNSASLQSRDFAIQVDGCKGVCVWSTNQQQLSFAKILGWKITKMANLSVAMVNTPLLFYWSFN
jgi:hypothetical protein